MKRPQSQRVGVFLQARLGSTRLPGKVLLPLAGKAVVEHAMTALRRCEADVNVLLTDYESADSLVQYARRCGFELFAGSSEDVLGRFASAARVYPVARVVRATADNPLVSSEFVDSLLRLHEDRRADFSGYLGMPVGLGVEIVNRDALLIEDREARDPFEREHVNPFLYRRPERFKIFQPEVEEPYRLADRSVTLDTEADYRYLEQLFGELYHGVPIEIDRVIGWLRDHPRPKAKEGCRSGPEGTLHSVG